MILKQTIDGAIYYRIDDAIRGAKQYRAKINSKRIMVDDIIKLAANLFGVSVEDIKSESRKRIYALPRQLSCYLAREYCKDIYGNPIPYSQIGLVLSRDHSSIMHGRDIIKIHLERNSDVADIIRYACTLIEHSLKRDWVAS